MMKSIILVSLLFHSMLNAEQVKGKFKPVSIEDVQKHLETKFDHAKYELNFKEKVYLTITVEYRSKNGGKIEKKVLKAIQPSNKYDFTFLASDGFKERQILENVTSKTYNKIVSVSYYGHQKESLGTLGLSMRLNISLPPDFLDNTSKLFPINDLLLEENKEETVFSQKTDNKDCFVKVSVKYSKKK